MIGNGLVGAFDVVNVILFVLNDVNSIKNINKRDFNRKL